MKISRSMSSSSARVAGLAGADALSSSSCVNSPCLPRNATCRRIRSIALLRPTLTSQARGLDGGPAAGQRSSATATASCSASSARSKSPTRRISVASARPASSRKIFSISARRHAATLLNDRHSGAARSCAHPESRDSPVRNRASSSRFARPGMTASPSIINHDRPDLDRTNLGAGNPCGNGKGGVEIFGLDQIIAAELLARFRKRTVRRQCLAVANAHGGRRRRRLQARRRP